MPLLAHPPRERAKFRFYQLAMCFRKNPNRFRPKFVGWAEFPPPPPNPPPPRDPLPPVEATISDRKTAKEPEKISSRTSFWAKSGLPSFLIGPSHFICYHVHGGLNKHPY